MLASWDGDERSQQLPVPPLHQGEEEQPAWAYLVGAVGVGDPREGLQGGGDGVGQDEGPRRRTVLLHLTHKDTAAGRTGG